MSGGILERTPETVRRRQRAERRASVRDRNEMPSGSLAANGALHELAEVLVERKRLDGASRLGGDDEDRPRRIDAPRNRRDSCGCGRIQHRQPGEARRAADALPDDLRPQAAAAHAQQHDVLESGGANLLRESAKVAQVLRHVPRDRQPAQPIRDLRGVVVPNRVVSVPDARDHVALRKLVQCLGYVRRIRAK